MAPDTVAGITIEQLDLVGAPDDVVADAHSVEAATDAEHVDDPDLIVPLDEFRAWFRARPSHTHRTELLAYDGDRCVGRAWLEYEDVPENRHLAEVGVLVVADHRRRRIGRTLARRAAQLAADEGRTLLTAYTRQVDPVGHDFASALGGDVRIVEHRNVLPVEHIPDGLLDDWVARAAERADGYSLVGWTGRCPDEWVERYCAAIGVMNTAPRGTLDVEDFTMTVEKLRAREAANERAGTNRPMILCAVHDASGDIAGITELYLPAHWPTHVWQGNTGVWPEHRNRGLGRWLKAANLQRLLDERPTARYVETWNAGSNEPMLAINHHLGFRLLEAWDCWQVPAASILATP